MYRTQINGKEVIYDETYLQYGALVIRYADMSDIMHVTGNKRAFRFRYQDRTLEIPYLEGEKECIMPYYQKAAAVTPETDPIEFADIEVEAQSGMHSDAQTVEAGQDMQENNHKQENRQKEQSRPDFDYRFNNDAGSCSGNTDNDYNTSAFSSYNNGYRSYEKNVFVWVFCFLLGCLGVDRFVRGQIGLGIFKLLLGGWGTFGIWPLVDWIIAMTKAYGAAYGNCTNVEFDVTGHYTR